MSRSYVRRMLVPLWAASLFLVGIFSAAAPEEPDPDEKTLRDAKIGADGPALLAFLRDRTLSDDDGKKLAALVRQLGHDSFDEREKASAALTKYGCLAVMYLRVGAKDADAEIATRCTRCLEEIAAGPGPELPLAALRLIARRRPDGAAEVLLRYLTFADDSVVENEAIDALAAVAVREGKADPAVARALADTSTLKRAAAARALGRAADSGVRAPVRRLLKDADPRVRLEAALGLVQSGEKDAVPTVIELLRADSTEIAGRAEATLFLIAGEKTPEATAGDGSAAARTQWRDAWAAWWQANADKADLTKVRTGEHKLGLVALAETSGGQKVWEFGRDGKERWRIGGYSWPMDVRILSNGHVLVADNMVTERDQAGKLIRQMNFAATAAQRLTNGNTFIGEYNRLLEVDRADKIVASHSPGGDTLTDALRLPNGNAVYITVRGLMCEITWPGGKEVKTLKLSNAAPQGTDWYRMETAPAGHFLIASHTDGRVFEIDAAGKVVWEYKVPQAYSATRLANGNILIATAESKRLIEVDRQHKVISERMTVGYLSRVRAR